MGASQTTFVKLLNIADGCCSNKWVLPVKPYGHLSITGCDITVYEMFSAGICLSIILSPLDMEIVKIVQLVLCLRLKELLFFCCFTATPQAGFESYFTI